MTARGDFPTLGQLVSGGFVEGYEEYFGTAEEIVAADAHHPVTGPCLLDRAGWRRPGRTGRRSDPRRGGCRRDGRRRVGEQGLADRRDAESGCLLPRP